MQHTATYYRVRTGVRTVLGTALVIGVLVGAHWLASSLTEMIETAITGGSI